MGLFARRAALALAAGALLAPVGAGAQGSAQRLSGASPFPAGCGDVIRDPGSGRTSDIAMAVDPLDENNVAVVWMQDSRGDTTANTVVLAVSMDGGQTFRAAPVPGASHCSGGSYAVVRDPDISFGADGRLYLGVIGAGVTTLEPSAALVSHSADGGLSWAPFTTIETSPLYEQIDAKDRTVVVADRTRAGTAYVLYMKLMPNFPVNNAILLSRTVDGGLTWSAPSLVFLLPGSYSVPNIGAFLSLLDGSLLHVFSVVPTTTITAAVIGAPLPVDDPTGALIVAARSTDMGASWSQPVLIGAHDFPTYEIRDPDTGFLIDRLGVRVAAGSDGTAYTVWQNRPDADDRTTMSLVRSDDGGRSWTSPVEILSEQRPIFQHNLAVSDGGALGLTFYDERSDLPGGSESSTDVWFRVSRDQGQTWAETHLAGPFDLRTTFVNEGEAPLGNPQALQPIGSHFAAAFNVGRPLATEADMAVLFALLSPGH